MWYFLPSEFKTCGILSFAVNVSIKQETDQKYQNFTYIDIIILLTIYLTLNVLAPVFLLNSKTIGTLSINF